MAIRDLGSFVDLEHKGPRVSANRGINGIDGTIACALGQARSAGRPMTVLMGDLAFLHDQSSLALVGDTNIRIVVVDNRGGGIFEHLPIAARDDVFEPYFLTPQDADIPAIAAGHGLPVDSVSTIEGSSQRFSLPDPVCSMCG